jgi:hypothetical protein
MSSRARLAAAALLAASLSGPALLAQARRGAAPRTPAAAPRTEAPMLKCPNLLGEGVQTKRVFCDVTIERDPMAGIIIPIPPHTGPVTLTFELHNRHTYSAELAKTNRGFRRYTATIGVLKMDNTLLSRAAVQTEFRTARDLLDRVSGGTGAGGVKAVAPLGAESVTVEIPAGETAVTILGEKLTEERIDAADPFTSIGRPIAVISNVLIQYRPGPAPRAPARRR